jgi:hypothetical protein
MDISSTSQTLELGCPKIDKEIQDAYELARKLRTNKNTLAYFSRLPTEIIARIFTTLAHYSSNHGSLSWIRSVTAVCGHWRAIALECPNLWSTIIFASPIWVEEMLKRSKMAPLTIKADCGFLEQLDAVRLALQHISRIRELHLYAPEDDMVRLINPIDQPAPLLRSLHLSCPALDFGVKYALPEAPFDCGGHHLHRLELVNCSIPWGSPLLCGLIHFKFNKSFGVTQISVTKLLEVLENMPLLETLDIEGLMPIPSSDFAQYICHI